MFKLRYMFVVISESSGKKKKKIKRCQSLCDAGLIKYIRNLRAASGHAVSGCLDQMKDCEVSACPLQRK